MSEERRRELLLFGCALALRLAWVGDMSRLPFFDIPTGDALFYAQQAGRIGAGHLIGTELSYPSSPLYPYLIAPFFLLPISALFWTVFVSQALIDAAHAVLLRRAGTLLFGRMAGSIA